jgi:hypothetical protein
MICNERMYSLDVLKPYLTVGWRREIHMLQQNRHLNRSRVKQLMLWGLVYVINRYTRVWWQSVLFFFCWVSRNQENDLIPKKKWVNNSQWPSEQVYLLRMTMLFDSTCTKVVVVADLRDCVNSVRHAVEGKKKTIASNRKKRRLAINSGERNSGKRLGSRAGVLNEVVWSGTKFTWRIELCSLTLADDFNLN